MSYLIVGILLFVYVVPLSWVINLPPRGAGRGVCLYTNVFPVPVSAESMAVRVVRSTLMTMLHRFFFS